MAYVRARRLGHPNPQEVERRIDRIFAHWREAVRQPDRVRYHSVDDRDEAVRAINGELENAAVWMRRFEEVEAELVAAGAEADFAAVERAMQRRGFQRLRPEEHGVRRSLAGFLTNPLSRWGLIGFLTALLGLAVLTFVKRVRRGRGTRIPAVR